MPQLGRRRRGPGARGTAARGTGARGATAARGGTGSGLLGDLIEVFQPSRRHVVEEQERRRDHAQLPESGGPPLVDLEAGTVVLPPVRHPARPPDHRTAADGAD
jgi:hypothetical protein